MTPDILTKIAAELNKGINTETQVVYLLASIRKIIEREKLYDRYEFLSFHCNWALHTRMDRDMAQKILSDFDTAQTHLATGIELTDLPEDIGKKIEKISKMEKFREELFEFLQELNVGDAKAGIEWVRFMHLYGQVIEDCPLSIKTNNETSKIIKITVSVETSKERPHGYTYYQVSWNIAARDGSEGTIFVINSYSDEE